MDGFISPARPCGRVRLGTRVKEVLPEEELDSSAMFCVVLVGFPLRRPQKKNAKNKGIIEVEHGDLMRYRRMRYDEMR